MVLFPKYTVPFSMPKEEHMAEKIDLGLGKAYDALFSSQEQRDDE